MGRGTGKGPGTLHSPHSQPTPTRNSCPESSDPSASVGGGGFSPERVPLAQRTWGGSGALSLTLGFFPQSLGLSSSHDRALVKRKVKELAAAAEKERKAQEKAARQREKLRRREQEAKKS